MNREDAKEAKGKNLYDDNKDFDTSRLAIIHFFFYFFFFAFFAHSRLSLFLED